MMKNLNLFLLCAAGSLTFAQTTITKAANDYLVGNTINQFAMGGTPNHSGTGLNATFNNNVLLKGPALTFNVSTPTAAEVLDYPGTTLKYSSGATNSIYYKSTGTELLITGYFINGSLLNFDEDNALFLKFPTAYSDTYTDVSSGKANFSGYSALFKGTLKTTADATGTLLMNAQSFPNIIRVKTEGDYNVYATVDPTYVTSIGTVNSVIYTYYDNTNRYPLFTSTNALTVVPGPGINKVDNLVVAQANTFLGTGNNNSVKNKLQVYPNPVKDNLFFAGDLGGFTQVQIYSMDGKLVETQTISSEKINLNKLMPGAFILKLFGTDKKTQSIQIIKN